MLSANRRRRQALCDFARKVYNFAVTRAREGRCRRWANFPVGRSGGAVQKLNGRVLYFSTVRLNTVSVSVFRPICRFGTGYVLVFR